MMTLNKMYSKLCSRISWVAKGVSTQLASGSNNFFLILIGLI